jgi:hypothetical protein
MSLELPNLDPLWVSVFVTCVLVVITAYYAWETRRMRLESAKPCFSLRTGIYTISGTALGLYLVNGGKVAKDVKIDVKQDKGITNLYYAPSIANGEEVTLDAVPEEARKRNGWIEVSLSFKDGYGRDLKESLKLDFTELSKEKRIVAYRSTPIESELKNISSSLRQSRR